MFVSLNSCACYNTGVAAWVLLYPHPPLECRKYKIYFRNQNRHLSQSPFCQVSILFLGYGSNEVKTKNNENDLCIQNSISTRRVEYPISIGRAHV